ncbi:MAG TPA: ACT domain-containing protein [Myxococcota bacterium]|nr:ACT domain-containing protein [Myxococcota bacterium]
MIHALSLTLRQCEGALVRTLGTVERRGFSIVSLEVTRTASHYALALRVSGPRDPAILVRQLARLVDVESVSPRQPGADGTAALGTSDGSPR